MPLSRSNSVLSKEDADKIAIVYSPKKFPVVIAPTASQFVSLQKAQTKDGKSPSFSIDAIVAQQTGIASLERASIEERVEQEAISRLKEMQEAAYKEAYALGLDEGTEKAYNDTRAALEERLASVDTILGKIENLKADLITFNEAHIIKLVYHMAHRLLMDEIEQRPDVILNVLKHTIESTQSEESVTVRLSQADARFIEEMRDKLGKEFEVVKRAKIEVSAEVAPGGCQVETNYGNIDATIEKRLANLWAGLVEKVPRVKDKVNA